MWHGPIRKGMKVWVEDIVGKRVATVTSTSWKEGQRIAFLDDGHWCYFLDVKNAASKSARCPECRDPAVPIADGMYSCTDQNCGWCGNSLHGE